MPTPQGALRHSPGIPMATLVQWLSELQGDSCWLEAGVPLQTHPRALFFHLAPPD